MERNRELKKFVYEDNQETKVIRGYILKEDEFIYVLEAERTGDIITLGKRSIIKVSDCGSGSHE